MRNMLGEEGVNGHETPKGRNFMTSMVSMLSYSTSSTIMLYRWFFMD